MPTPFPCKTCDNNSYRFLFDRQYSNIWTGPEVTAILKDPVSGLYTFAGRFPLNQGYNIVPGTVVITVDNPTASNYVADDVTATTNPNGCRQLQTASSATAVGEVCSYTGQFFKFSITIPAGQVEENATLDTIIFIQFQTTAGKTEIIRIGQTIPADPCLNDVYEVPCGNLEFQAEICPPDFCAGDTPYIAVTIGAAVEVLGTFGSDGNFTLTNGAYSSLFSGAYIANLPDPGSDQGCCTTTGNQVVTLGFNNPGIDCTAILTYVNGSESRRMLAPDAKASACTYTYTFAGTDLTAISSLLVNGVDVVVGDLSISGANLAADLTDAATKLTAETGITFTSTATTLVATSLSTLGAMSTTVDAAPFVPTLAISCL